uniref:Uncharacterized protein n=1 Tax=Nelumbo nucifera TaxID=4432 RepID=A0A822XVL6_NELNU|nr:TPA_asm: hypothetical protein HUJ06_024592 [Nelumbo nucifera]
MPSSLGDLPITAWLSNVFSLSLSLSLSLFLSLSLSPSCQFAKTAASDAIRFMWWPPYLSK